MDKTILRFGDEYNWPDYRNYSADEWPEDVALLRGIMNGLGYDASPQDTASAYAAWSEEEYCASWLNLPNDTEALQHLVRHMIERGYLVTT